VDPLLDFSILFILIYFPPIGLFQFDTLSGNLKSCCRRGNVFFSRYLTARATRALA